MLSSFRKINTDAVANADEALGTNEFIETARRNKIDFDLKQKIRYDHHAKDLKDLHPGTLIWIQNDETRKWDQKGIVVEQTRQRTYKVQLDSGKMVYRNRKKIRKRDNITSHVSGDVGGPVLEDTPRKSGNVRRSERIRKTMNT